MTRIIAGDAGSLRLQVPERGTRPTSDRVREAIFSTLEAWDCVSGARVLDLYAGSGALGLEAVSRGAADCTLVEKHPAAARVARRNSDAILTAVKRSGREASATVLQRSVQQFLTDTTANTTAQTTRDVQNFDIVFIDPPYDFTENVIAENLAAVVPLLAPDAVVLIERDRRSPAPTLPDSLSLLRSKSYGETTCWWCEKSTD